MQFVCGKGHAPGFSQLRAPYSKRPVKGDNNLRFGGETYRKEEANMTMVYVVSKNGKPLMPTRRCGHVRILLKQKKAALVTANPFTIRLLYDTPEIVQPLYLGIDPGRTNVGMSVVTAKAEPIFQAECVTRNKEVPKLMKERKQHRQQSRHYRRRCKRQRRAKKAGTVSEKGENFKRKLPGCKDPIVCHAIKNKEARFNNRVRSVSWLTPTATHLLRTHINLIEKIRKFLPITDVVLETNRFAFMRLDDPTIEGINFCNGRLKGMDGVKGYIWKHQNGRCLFCGKPIEHYHHVVPRKRNGSETVSNRVGLCEQHHELVHKDETWAEKLEEIVSGEGKRYHALSVLNQIIPSLIAGLKERFPQHVHLTEGKTTNAFREQYGLEKTHALDAFCIACAPLDHEPNGQPELPTHTVRQFRRHDRQATHKENLKRIYLDDGKPVAVNRHKAADQKEDSLEEFRQRNSEAVISGLTVKLHPRQYKDSKRMMPGSVFVVAGQKRLHVLQGSHGRSRGQADYFIDCTGRRHNARKTKTVYKNTGLVFV